MTTATTQGKFYPLGFTQQIIENLFCSAIEGGSNYWYLLGDLKEIEGKYNRKTDPLSEVIPRLCLKDASIRIPVYDLENPKEILGFISQENMKDAELFMREHSPQHYADAISGNDDAITGDVYFQYVVMHEIVFG